MALRGKIDDFGIVEILQLISQQQRSGILTIQSNRKRAEIIFFQGMITKANPFYLHPQKPPFAATSLATFLVSPEELELAEKKAEENLKSLEENFLDLNLLNIALIQKINEYLIIETLYEVLQWKSGEYEFILNEIKYDARFSPLIPPEHILLDILRMIDEEPEFFRKISSLEMVFQKASLEEGGDKQLEGLGINEKTVYHLIDGTKTVQDIIIQSLLGKYSTLKAIVTLAERGLIRKKRIKKVSVSKPLTYKNRGEYIFYGILPIILMLFLFGLRFLLTFYWSGEDDRVSYKKIFPQTQVQKIQTALCIYFLEKGKYPLTLSDLVNNGLLSPDDLERFTEADYGDQLREKGNHNLLNKSFN